MVDRPPPTETLLDFMLELVGDVRSGRVRELSDYQERYPAHADEIARRWEELQRESTSDVPGRSGDDVDGRRVAHYRLEAELGRGGQGAVYRAHDEKLGRTVALKVLHAASGFGEEGRLRFRREAEVVSKLDHPAIATVFEVGEEDGLAWIAMRHVVGVPLGRRIVEHVAGEGSLPEVVDPGGDAVGREALGRLVTFVEATARALHVAHEAGIVHRDVKPANIMVTAALAPVVLDFGLARDVDAAATLTLSGDVFGTPAYMSPEQVAGSTRLLDRRTDVWSLGVVLFQCLTGRLPFEAPTVQGIVDRIRGGDPPAPRRLEPRLPRDLDAIVRTAMEPDLRRRYQSAHELAEDLRRFREDEPIRARPPGPIVRAVRWSRRHPVVSLAAAALLATSALGVFARDRAVTAETRRLMLDRDVAEELLVEERDALWPVGPALVARCDGWLTLARELEDRRDAHDAMLRDLAAAEGLEAVRLAEREQAHLAALERLVTRVPVVEERRRRSASLRRRTVDEPAEAWRACAAEVRGSSRYGGLELAPQLGLVPLRANATGLWEFWVAESGARPPWDEGRGGHRVDVESGIVLVLIPGGEAELGSRADEVPAEIRETNEGPVQRVTLDPYFASRYEVTQAQWMALFEGANPSQMPPGYDRLAGYEVVDHTHPVEAVSPAEAQRGLARLDLDFPTEAQWEHACRAGTRTIWSFGDAWREVALHANVRGAEAGDPAPFRDDWIRHAPVGSFAPNGFGLHDMHGNVWEPCRDAYVDALTEPRPGDGLMVDGDGAPFCAIRGGGAMHAVGNSRSSGRSKHRKTEGFWDLGVRPFRRVVGIRESGPDGAVESEEER